MQGVPTLDEPKGREEQREEPEAGAVLEGAEHDEGSAASSTRGVRVPPLRASVKSPAGLDLDLQVQADEPTQLVRLLAALAREREDDDGPRHREWGIVARYAEQAAEALEKGNQPIAR